MICGVAEGFKSLNSRLFNGIGYNSILKAQAPVGFGVRSCLLVCPDELLS